MLSSMRSSTVARAATGRVACKKTVSVVCKAAQGNETRRQLLLKSVNVGVIASVFTWGAVERPRNLGVQDYGGGVKLLGLCPPTPNCISTSEDIEGTHYAPPLTYNPQDGRGSKGPATREQAMDELVKVVTELKPDGFTPTIIKRGEDYLYVEYQSPTFGFIDDVEFYFPPGEFSRVEYRSASRVGESDGQVNRKRIKAIRQALETKGWASVGF